MTEYKVDILKNDYWLGTGKYTDDGKLKFAGMLCSSERQSEKILKVIEKAITIEKRIMKHLDEPLKNARGVILMKGVKYEWKIKMK